MRGLFFIPGSHHETSQKRRPLLVRAEAVSDATASLLRLCAGRIGHHRILLNDVPSLPATGPPPHHLNR